MRIAIWHILPSGGGKRALYDHVRGLLARGHHVEAWTSQTADQKFLPLSDIIKEHVVPMKVHGRTDWEKRLRIPQSVSLALSAIEQHSISCALEINQGNFDLLYVHPCIPLIASSISYYVKIPSVFYLQEPSRNLYEAMPELHWLKPKPSIYSFFSLNRLREIALYRRNLLNCALQGRRELTNVSNFDKILVNSLFSRESLLRAYGLDSEVCYLGTDLKDRINYDGPRERMFVGLGSFSRSKNIGFVIQSVALMTEPRPDLVWIGNSIDHCLMAELVTMAAALNVKFIPHVMADDATVTDLMNRSTAMIYAPRLEPFGLAPIEAAACGLPVIAVAEGGVRETVIDNVTGLLVQNTHQAVADAAQALLDDPEFARKLGREGRRNAEKMWSFDSMIDRVEGALMRVVSEYPRKAN